MGMVAIIVVGGLIAVALVGLILIIRAQTNKEFEATTLPRRRSRGSEGDGIGVADGVLLAHMAGATGEGKKGAAAREAAEDQAGTSDSPGLGGDGGGDGGGGGGGDGGGGGGD